MAVKVSIHHDGVDEGNLEVFVVLPWNPPCHYVAVHVLIQACRCVVRRDLALR